MRTRYVLVAGFVLVLAALMLRAFALSDEFDRALARYDALASADARATQLVSRLTTLPLDLETGLRGFQVTGDRAFLEPYERATREIGPTLEQLRRVGGDDAAWSALADRLADQIATWNGEVARPTLAERPDDPGRAARARRGKEEMDAVRRTLLEMSASLAARREARASALVAFRTTIHREVLVSALAVGGVLLALLALMARSVERPLAHLAAHVAEGGPQPALAGAAREVRELADALHAANARIAGERDRERRFTELVSALSVGGDAPTLAATALRALVDEHRAAGGALWIAPDADAPLVLGAVFAIDRAALPEGGDPLAREVRASGAPVFVAGLAKRPKHVVRSALVDVVPAALLATPVRAGGHVIAVLELAGDLAEPSWPEIDRTLARVGLALENALAVDRVAALQTRVAAANDELRGQNEELRAQQEELRAQSEELRQQRAELARRNEELVRASQHKNDFVSSMSHELRTPLNAVIGFADLLLAGAHGPLAPAQRQAIADVLGAGRQLLALVNDILDLAKVEAGRLDVHPRDVELAPIARDAAAMLEPTSERRGVRVDVRVPPSLAVLGDPDRVRQVLLNLLSNAIKFAPSQSEVTVVAARSGDAVRVEVTDRGPGIAPSEGARLFQPFTQLDAARSHGGTGLGLAISKRLVEAMGGAIGVTTAPGAGATFHFTLPLGTGSARPPPTRPSPSSLAPRARVLVVEDEATSARVTESVLTAAGYAVTIEPSAERALARLDGDAPPQLLVIDLGLPGMSGFALIDRVRAEAERVPIVVLTGRDLSEQESAALASKVDLVAQKGMMTGAGFVDTIATIVARGHGVPPVRVLVVDDNEANRRVARGFLGGAGYEVIEATDAESGLALAKAQTPDVVLMDVRLPGMDGLEATRRLVGDPATRACRVIALSAQAMLRDRERAIEAGCDAYLAKPVGRRELVDAVRAALAMPPRA